MELDSDDFVLVEELLLEDSVVRGIGVVDSVVVDGVVVVVVFPRDSVHRKNKECYDSTPVFINLCSAYRCWAFVC